MIIMNTGLTIKRLLISQYKTNETSVDKKVLEFKSYAHCTDDSKMGLDELYEIKLVKNVCQKQNIISVYQFKLSTTIC